MTSLHWIGRLGRDAARHAIDLLYPPVCVGCDRLLDDGESAVCGRCRATVVPIGRRGCRRCGAEPLRSSSPRPDRCRRCARRPFAFRRAVAALRYSGAVREAILRLKFEGRREAASWLADHVADAAAHGGLAARTQCVVGVPLNPWRRLRRGFDQADLLAELVARRIDRPLRRGAIWRPALRTPQSLARVGARSANVAGAFGPGWLGRRVRGRHVLLIDDVMSTGATLHEAATALLRAGARRVDAAVAAT